MQNEHNMESIVYVGIDVHKDSYSICCYKSREDRFYYEKKLKAESKPVIKYLESFKKNLEKIQFLFVVMKQDLLDLDFIVI